MNYDSELCGNLPIHLTNQIQPYGALLVIDLNSMDIIQASENVKDIFSSSVEEIVNTNLFDHLGKDAVEELRKKLEGQRNDRIPANWKVGDKHFLVLIHRKDRLLLVELEAEPLSAGTEATFVEVYQELKYAMSSIESAEGLEETCALAAKELKRISGFDKVMIYRFDNDWNGLVVAEEREGDMETYLGLTFPASDIPAQARRLYLRSPYRYIPDRDYLPVRLYPVLNSVTNSFTDLSDCNVRSVASVHVEYLKNMDVGASMSTRILHQDNLWGLIACHHKTARRIDFKLCSVFEMFSGIISMKISSLEYQSGLSMENALRSRYSSLVESIYKAHELDETLLKNAGLLALFDATGAAVSRNGKISTVGKTPRIDQLDELVLWLNILELKNIYQTSQLPGEYEYAKDYQDVASGLLVIPINAAKDQFLMLFRPEKVKVIKWGGNPDERIQYEPDQKGYHPRNSFRLWQQKVSGISEEWRKQELRFAEMLRSFIYEYETSGLL